MEPAATDPDLRVARASSTADLADRAEAARALPAATGWDPAADLATALSALRADPLGDLPAKEDKVDLLGEAPDKEVRAALGEAPALDLVLPDRAAGDLDPA